MWFMNRIANPIVRLILRSRLHGLLSAALLVITYRGRKSGREYSLPVQYVRSGNFIYIIPGMAEQKVWWRSLRGCAAVELLLAGKALKGQAAVLEGEAEAERIAEALCIYLKRFPEAARMHGVGNLPEGGLDPNALRQAARGGVVVRVAVEG